MSSLENLLNRLTQDIKQSNKHYVYYNQDTKRIHKISPVKQKTDLEVIEVESSKVETILKGVNKLDDYIVYFDYESKKHSIQKRKQEQFSNISLIEILDYSDELSDLIITLTKDKLLFNVHPDLVDHMQEDASKLLFVITEQHNPYVLYETIDIQAKQILDNATYKHQLTLEQIANGVSIYTNKVFNTYTLKVDYD